MTTDALERLRALRAGQPLDAEPTAVAEITTPDDLPDEWRELWHERAAHREYDGGQAREHAEAEALAEVLARMNDRGTLP